uniref:Uncharacterized protein n=1 Tax=Leishmania amazonensis TaxID=5659 RepID=Q6T9E0_LEIAM|nr:hypothetical protein [Leishmania amazonensis]
MLKVSQFVCTTRGRPIYEPYFVECLATVVVLPRQMEYKCPKPHSLSKEILRVMVRNRVTPYRISLSHLYYLCTPPMSICLRSSCKNRSPTCFSHFFSLSSSTFSPRR